MKIKSSLFGTRKACLQVLLPAVLILSCCSSEAAIQSIMSGSATAPVFLECKAISATEIVFRFSEPVRMKSLYLDPSVEILSYIEGEEILITLSEALMEGARIIADILVEDGNRNTLNVLTPFRARNDRVPKLIINELRTENSSTTRNIEFIEFVAKSAGNLGALRLFLAGHSITQPVYEFPPVEVQSGEYIVLHLRSVEGCVDETGNDLTLSGGTESCPEARDLWVPGNAKLIHKTDVVYLVDQDDKIIDAVLMSESAGPAWGKADLANAAGFLASQGAWFPRGTVSPPDAGSYALTPADALISTGTTATRTINRDETLVADGRPENWYITATSNATPGKPNSLRRYVP